MKARTNIFLIIFNFFEEDVELEEQIAVDETDELALALLSDFLEQAPNERRASARVVLIKIFFIILGV
nr:hypothetical protein [Lactococcus cremoris]